MNLTPNEQAQESSNHQIEKDSNNIKRNVKRNMKSTKKKGVTPKTHNHQFSMQSIINSVAGIGLESANDFSFADIGEKNQPTTAIENIAVTEHFNSPLDTSIVDTSVDTSVDVENKEHTSNISNTPVPNKPVSAEDARQTVQSKTIQKHTTSTSKVKRSKKINKAKLQKVFHTDAFKKSNRTIRILPGLSKLVKEVSDRSAREIVSELLIKWLLKEYPKSEPALLQLLDQHLDAG